jgi:hypothetical protein
MNANSRFSFVMAIPNALTCLSLYPSLYHGVSFSSGFYLQAFYPRASSSYYILNKIYLYGRVFVDHHE